MKAAIYTRISSDQTGQAVNVGIQKADCLAWCKAEGIDVYDVYTDNDLTASSLTKPRPDYRRLLADAKAGHFGMIVAYQLDRLHRHPKELEEFIETADALRMRLKTLHGEQDLATSSGRLHARIMGSVAKHESELKAERVRRKLLYLAEQGHLSGGGRRAFGYDQDGMTVREPEAALIREAADHLLSGGSLRSLVADWNRRGIPTVSGGSWHATVIRQIVTAPRTAGLRSHKGAIYPGTWPAILTPDQRDALVARLGDRRHKHGDPAAVPTHDRGRPAKYLLSGLARCGVCGSKLYGKRPDPRDKSKVAYCCIAERCGKIRILAADVDRLLGEEIVRRYHHDRGPGVATPSAAPAARLVDVAKLRKKLATLEDDYYLGDMPEGRYNDLRARLVDRIAEAAAALVPVGPPSLPHVPISTFAEWWASPESPLEDKRKFLTAFFHRIEVAPAGKARNRFDGDRVHLTWAVGGGPEWTEDIETAPLAEVAAGA